MVPDNFAFNGKNMAWHNSGTAMSEIAKTDYREALREGGLLYEVQKLRLKNPLNPDIELPIFGNFRTDNGQYLGDVKGKYQVIDNERAFNFLEELIDEGVTIDSCGTFEKGAVVFLNAVLKTTEISDGYAVKNFLQFVNSFNGGKPLKFFQSNVQIVCSNTLNHACAEAKQADQMLNVRHTKNALVKLNNAKRFLELAGKSADSFVQKLRFLGSKTLKSDMQEIFFNKLFPVEIVEGETIEESRKNRQNKIDRILSVDGLNGFTSYSGTALEALNRVTAYYNHFNASVKKVNGKTEDIARAQSAMFGTGAKVMESAFDLLLDMYE